MKRVLPLRIYLIAQTIFGATASFWAANEQVYALQVVGGALAYWVTILMIAFAGVAALDVWAGEYSHSPPNWLWVRRRRWLVWMTLGIGWALQAGVASINGFMPWLAGQFFITAAGCAAVAILDVHYRGIDEKLQRRVTGCADFDSRPIDRSWPA